jgi:PAS domain S-box-containing protein
MKLGAKITVAFVLALLIIGGVGVRSYLVIQRLTETKDWVDHTHEVLQNLEHVESVVTKAETGARGFVLTGDEHFLAPYDSAIAEVQKDVASVKSLTRDNPDQQRDLVQLQQLCSEKLDVLKDFIQHRREGGLEAALPIIKSGNGARIMDEIRNLVAVMEQRENRLLDVRSREAGKVARQSMLTLGLGVLLSLAILGAAAVIVIRTMRLADRPPRLGGAGRTWPRTAVRYAFAAAVVALAAWLKGWLERNVGPVPTFVTFYPAVLLVATVAGGGPGVVATVLTVLAADYWFIPPIGSFSIARASDAVSLGIFASAGIFLSLLAERLRRARVAEAVSAAQEKELALVNLGNLMARSQDDRILRWSDGNRRLYGYDSDEAEGKSASELLQTHFDRSLEQIHADLELNGRWEGEVTRRRKDGAQLSIALVWALRRDERGKPLDILEVSTDITERKRAEAEREAFARQRQIALDAARLGWWHYDPLTRMASWDDRYKEIFGVTGHQRLNDEILAQMIHPEDLPALWAKVEAALNPAAPRPFAAEYRINRPDGAVRWVEAHGIAEFDGDGANRRAVSFVGTVADITERKQAEDALRVSERRERERAEELAVLFESVPAAVFVARDPDCRHLDGNRLAGEILRVPTGDELSLSAPAKTKPSHFRTLKDGRELSLDELPAQRAARGEHVKDFEMDLAFDDGMLRHVLGYGTPLLDAQGRPRGSVAVLVDVTERKQAEEALREMNLTLEKRVVERTEESRATALYARSLLEASLDPLVTISPDGKITDVNAATELVTGAPRAQLVGTSFSDYFTEPSKANAGYQQVLRDGTVRDYPLTIRHASGRTTDVLYNATIYRNEAGEVQGVFAAARDVTERNKMEQELARYRLQLEELVKQRTSELEKTAAELERSNKDLEQFAYVASHDLQEPLRAVGGFASLLRQQLRDKLDADGRKYMGYVVEGAERMQALINDLLTYSRVGSRGGARTPVSMKQALDDAVGNLSAAIEESRAVIRSDPLPAVTADRSQMVQLLQNLVGNAIKFHGPRAPEIHIGAAREKDAWIFSVRDNGIGIEPKYHDRIFLIFQRLHSRIEYPGTGIGLAVCKKIVERHYGRIWFESQPGEGTTFFFTISDKRSDE